MSNRLRYVIASLAFLSGALLLAACTEENTRTETGTKISVHHQPSSALALQTSAMTAALPVSASPLAGFYQALFALQNGYGGSQVNILHLGDSHTAGDKFSGRLRELFQERFGTAGRGMLPAGEPFDYYSPTQVKVSQTKGWKVLNSHRQPENGPYGLSGFRVIGRSASDSIVLEKTDQRPFTNLDLEILNQPGGGVLRVRIDNNPYYEIDTNASKRRVDLHSIPALHGGMRVELSPKGNGPVELLSMQVRQDSPGVIYHSHGIIGTTINIIKDWNPVLVAGEIKHLAPDLIVVAYGTNEGFYDDLNLAEYEQQFSDRLSFLHQAWPQASIVVVGPPDGNRLPNYCKKQSATACLPLSRSEKNNYQNLLRRRSPQLCRWHAPPMLEEVRDIQRRVAERSGYFYWDWSKPMGKCGAHVWLQREPALMYGDHIHMTTAGYEKAADALFMELMEYFPGRRSGYAAIQNAQRAIID